MKTSECIWSKPGSIAESFWKNGKADFPIYDMHGHMGSHNAIFFKRCEAAEMVKHMKKIGVRRLVFSHHQSLFDVFSNQQVHEITKAYDDILRMYVSINPSYQDRIIADLKKFDKWSPLAIGLKLLPGYHVGKVTDKSYEYALKFANERKLPILVHTWGGSQTSGADIMLSAAQKYPNIKFFMGHSFSGDWEGAKRVFEQAPGNVYFELTSLPGQNGVIERLVHDIGSKYILFGTDMPWFDEYQAVGGILGAKISENDVRNILYKNAERILGKNW